MTWNLVETYTAPGRQRPRSVVASTLCRIAGATNRRWRSYRTRRALMKLEQWQREDCGIDRPDIPTLSQLEAAAWRRLTNGMPTDWR